MWHSTVLLLTATNAAPQNDVFVCAEAMEKLKSVIPPYHLTDRPQAVPQCSKDSKDSKDSKQAAAHPATKVSVQSRKTPDPGPSRPNGSNTQKGFVLMNYQAPQSASKFAPTLTPMASPNSLSRKAVKSQNHTPPSNASSASSNRFHPYKSPASDPRHTPNPYQSLKSRLLSANTLSPDGSLDPLVSSTYNLPSSASTIDHSTSSSKQPQQSPHARRMQVNSLLN
jgi:hypothetical protein